MLSKLCIVAATAAALVSGETIMASTESTEELEHQQAFSEFIKTHNKEFPIEEVFSRYNTFKNNKKMIDAHNAKEDKTFTMAINHLADLSADEVSARHKGFNYHPNSYMMSQNQLDLSEHGFTATEFGLGQGEVDWVAKGAVTAVKNQGHCGSCWTFSTTGGVEGAVAVATGKLISLSEQQLSDCATPEGNKGCHGGAPAQGMEYVIQNGGLGSEESYPYVANNPDYSEPCRQGNPSVSKISSYKMVKQGDEQALLGALQLGPISIGIDANAQGFQFYNGGVFTGPCERNIDHAVLLVAAGNENGLDFWKIKNSWGPQWGEGGYIKFARGQMLCGISLYAVKAFV